MLSVLILTTHGYERQIFEKFFMAVLLYSWKEVTASNVFHHPAVMNKFRISFASQYITYRAVTAKKGSSNSAFELISIGSWLYYTLHVPYLAVELFVDFCLSSPKALYIRG